MKLITAEQAKANTEKYSKSKTDFPIDEELTKIFEKIKEKSESGNPVGWIVVDSINEENAVILLHKGYKIANANATGSGKKIIWLSRDA